jgi:ankyrin repeat protein
MGIPRSISQANIQNLNNSIKFDQNIQKMINKKSSLNINEELKLHPYKLETPLKQPDIIMAARNCDTKTIESKIHSGVSVSTTNSLGETALHWTARINCIEGTKLLLNSNASANIKDHSGKTPIEWANLSHNTEALKLLKAK